ncbi:MAG: penicillin acylase family protein [Betaproteobacteria bacterium]
MKHLALVILAAACASCASKATPTPDNARDAAAWERQARNVDIVRDDWGIAHVHGRTDADAVFGMIYAQAEDDFNRVETNYLLSMGRLAEAEGDKEIYRDLRMKLFIDPADLKATYEQSPDWLKRLMTAWADGLNFYLYKHPEVKPKVITRFEPWMALSFTEGSIGGDIERVDLKQLEAFYGKAPVGTQASNEQPEAYVEPTGSNGIAIAPSDSASHHALLWINPHTSFFFRSELQMASDEGLDAYGAVTWGQFFVYQGFNERAGWMHTSSGVDNIDEYLETVTKKGDGYVYRYGNEERPVKQKTIAVPYRTTGGMATKTFTAYFTQHGPVVREQDGKWVSISLMQDPLHALIQSYTRTKAHDLKAFRQAMELHTNSSNNTIFADADGDIAYFHSNFIPKRDPRFDWTKPVDGSDPATDWHGVLSIDESPNAINPANGWVYNSNNWPWSTAGPDSPKRADYPAYVERGTEETPRGYHALRVLGSGKNFTPDSLTAAAFDSYLPAFDRLLPPLFKAYDRLPAASPIRAQLKDQIALLRGWDHRWGASSVPTSLAVFWGEEAGRRVAAEARAAGMSADDYTATKAAPDDLLQALAAASGKLAADFGTWKTPWGDINRFQRINDDITPSFDDSKPSIPVAFTSSRWGSLASFGARAYPNTKKWYGTSGNSFVAVVEFGDRVSAKAVTAGGESGHPDSPHFNDEAERYASGNLREVYYYPEELKGHTERSYHPGS